MAAMRSARLALVTLASGFALAASGGQASAAVTVGQTFIPDQPCNAFTFLQTTSPQNAYTFPSQGVLTAWRIQGTAETGVVARLKVGRGAGGDTYSIVGQSPTQAIAPSTLNSFPDRVPVRAGDFLGLWIDSPAPSTNCYRLGSGYASASEPGDVQPGAPTAFTPSTGGQFNVAATVEPDADGDGFGDETQDACPVDPLLQVECIVDTRITARPKDVTKRRRVIYEFSASVPSATFECSFDGPYEPCTSPRIYRRVKKGRHKFIVRATDVRNGLVDSTPAVDKFKLKRKKRKR